MAFNTEHLTNLGQLQQLAQKLQSDYATQAALDAVSAKVATLEAANGETNVIETVKVNGTALSVSDKTVDVTVPTAVSELTNDSEYQTAAQVSTTVAAQIAEVVAEAPESYDTLKEIADWISSHSDSASAMNSAISDNAAAIAALEALVGTLPEGTSASTVVAYIEEAIAAIDLSDYAKSTEVASAITTALAAYVTADSLSETLGSYVTTTALATKLADYYTAAQVDSALASYATTAAVTAALESYTTTEALNTLLGDYVLASQIATDDEFTEMMSTVFSE